MDGSFAAATLWLSLAVLLGLGGLAVLIGHRFRARGIERPPRHAPAATQAEPHPTGGPSAHAALDTPGTLGVLGRYRLIEEIGSGGMGRVFLGRDPTINRVVAIKTFELASDIDLDAGIDDADAADDAGPAHTRLLREVEAAGRLSHPNIVAIYDAGEHNGVPYIAMEYARGRRLSEFTKPDALLPPSTVLELLSRAADALHYAHGRNVVHRDIKPANIMYDAQSNALKLTDFGIARLVDAARTRAGVVLGTPSFMSPEQLEGRNVNGHTDLFALGVTLFELLTGQLPFRGNSMTKLMFVIANEPHQSVTSLRGELPASLDAMLDTALAKDPSQRYPHAAAMAHALREAAGQVA